MQRVAAAYSYHDKGMFSPVTRLKIFFAPETYISHLPESCIFLTWCVSRAVYTMNRTNMDGPVDYV